MAVFVVDKFRKRKLLKKQEKRLGWKNNVNSAKVLMLTSVVMPYSNSSNVFMKKKRRKKWKQEKITEREEGEESKFKALVFNMSRNAIEKYEKHLEVDLN